MPTLLRGESIGVGADELVVEQCPSCSVIYAIPALMKEKALERRGPGGRSIYCPNGHTWHYAGKTEAELLREEVEATRQRLAATRDLLAAEERSHSATRGHLTRVKKRAVAGVCPHPECRRHFQNLERHMETKHPNYVEPLNGGHLPADLGERTQSSDVGELGERVLEFLSESDRRWATIRDHLGVPDSTTGNLLQRLLALGLVERVETGLYRKAR